MRHHHPFGPPVDPDVYITYAGTTAAPAATPPAGHRPPLPRAGLIPGQHQHRQPPGRAAGTAALAGSVTITAGAASASMNPTRSAG